MFVILHTYHTRRGCRTIRRMIGRWAPPGENRTDSYVRHVSSRAGFPPDREVDISDRDLMVSIVAAMSWVENGREAALDDVRAGWELYREDRG